MRQSAIKVEAIKQRPRFTFRKAFVNLVVNQTFPLFKPPYALYFFACSFLHFGTFSVAGGLALFLPEILNRLSHATDEGPKKLCQVLMISNDESNVTDTVGNLQTLSALIVIFDLLDLQ